MKILIYGAGVIGCTYGWQLAKAGCDITILVRPEKKQNIEKHGINIHCSDFRSGEEEVNDFVFNPKVIDTILPDNDFEYIIVSVGCHRLKEILPILKESSGKAHILFFQNLWHTDFELIDKYLSNSRCFFGFPFMAGGGKNKNDIESIISGSKYSRTMLGERDGKVSKRIETICNIMEKANMKPLISKQIKMWLVPHYAFIACISAGIINAGGSMDDFIFKTNIIKNSVRAIQDSFLICKQAGYNPKKEKVNRIYYMPLFICIPVIKKIFRNKSMGMMFDNFLDTSIEEIREMINNVINDAEKSSIEIYNLRKLRESI